MIPLKVILKQDIPNLGQRGTVKEVADGYARNMLLPRGLADEATPKKLQEWEKWKRQAREKAVQQEVQVQELAVRLEGKVISFMRPSGGGGRLFGSVTAADVVAALAREGFTLDKKRVILPEPIKHPGEHSVSLRLGSSVKATVVIKVEQESRED